LKIHKKQKRKTNLSFPFDMPAFTRGKADLMMRCRFFEETVPIGIVRKNFVLRRAVKF